MIVFRCWTTEATRRSTFCTPTPEFGRYPPTTIKSDIHYFSSIARTAEISREQIAEYVRSLPDGVLPLSHEREFKLAKQILKFSDCLLNVLEALQLHKLCDYVYALATTFHDFYKECYVINKNADGKRQRLPSNEHSYGFLNPTFLGTTTIHYHRLVLCETTADVMDACFHILGITPVPRM